MTNLCSEERFLKDIKNHTMEIIRDEKLYRHISFTRNGSSVYRFDLITWPGHLCITGDCGTYVFRRLTDMFEFFRAEGSRTTKKLAIKPYYWGEKLESIGTNAGHREFDSDHFERRVTEHFHDFFEDKCDVAKAECWRDIEESVLSSSNDEHEAYAAVSDFSFDTPKHMDDFHFQDFFDGGETGRYTFHYIWCLYAIAYGVQEYDKQK
jgi:hypothetical protein